MDEQNAHQSFFLVVDTTSKEKLTPLISSLPIIDGLLKGFNFGGLNFKRSLIFGKNIRLDLNSLDLRGLTIKTILMGLVKRESTKYLKNKMIEEYKYILSNLHDLAS